MQTNNLTSRYHILVVTGQTRYSQTALQNAINLAKKIDGSINLFYVKSPSKVASHENQLAAFRELNVETAKAEKTMKQMVDMIASTEKIPITYSFTYGNVINEVQKQIEIETPDIVVLEKQKSSAKDLFGMDLTSYLLKNYKGAMLISGELQALGSEDDLSLGVLDDVLEEYQNDLSDILQKSTDKPITLLRINSSESSDNGSSQRSSQPNLTTFEFEQGTNISSSISKYVEKSGVGLLCVRKSKLMDLNGELKSVSREIQLTVQKTNAPVLILES